MTESIKEIADSQHGFVGVVPINNIWLLMFYASELAFIDGVGKFAFEKPPNNMFDFISKLLAHAVERRIHKNLTLGFTTVSNDLSRVRGKIDCLRTERKALLSKGRVSCTYDSLQTNTPLNQYVLEALQKARRLSSEEVAFRCKRLASTFIDMGVTKESRLYTQNSISQYGYMHSDDKLMLSAAKLVHEMMLPTEAPGAQNILAANREEHWVRRLFEKAIGGFYKANLTADSWKVALGSQLRWQINTQSTGIAEILPRMQTDIILEDTREGRAIVVDTKFTNIIRKGYRREKTLISSYIYQMYSYLFSQDTSVTGNVKYQEGLLLHPSINCDVDECVVIQGKLIRFATVDLTKDAHKILERLIYLSKPFPFSVMFG